MKTIITILSSFIGLVLIFMLGERKGKEKEQNKQNKRVLDNVKKSKDIVNKLDDSKHNRLRKKYKRK